ncbi:MAG TPA: DUF1015 family protein, partial [candidate division Zixibacteria bacterium]|nr:DUF1015 family protein [candidate division Zixibacteria bacterium]
HELWVISHRDTLDSLAAAFGRLPYLYIADGHHRSAAAAEVAGRRAAKNPHHSGDEHYNFFMNVIFPDDELRILPYNRVVRSLNGMTLEELFARAGDTFTFAPSDAPVEPQKPYEFGLYAAGRWYRMSARPGKVAAAGPAEAIDSAVLTRHFLTPYLGIKDIRTDDRIDFVGGIRGVNELERLVDSGAFAIAFSLFPATVDQLLAVADAGEVMPPKSTWFEPKLRSGLVVNYLDE